MSIKSEFFYIEEAKE
jgi:hypothetical protein